MKGYRIYRLNQGKREYLDQERDVWYFEGVLPFETYLEAKERFKNFKKTSWNENFKIIHIEGPKGGHHSTNLIATDAGIARRIYIGLKCDLAMILAHDEREELLNEWKMRFHYFLKTQKPNSLRTHQILEIAKWVDDLGVITRSEFFMYLLAGAE